MKTYRITFENSQGYKLSARLEMPPDQKPYTYALFAHCFTCNKNLNSVRNISRALTQKGIGVFRFDFAGLGDSGGDFAETNFSTNVQDLLDAAEFMTHEYGAPGIMIGHSLGGAASLVAASEIESVKAVVTIGAPFDPEHVSHLFDECIDEIKKRGEAKVKIGGRPFIIQEHFLEALEKHDLGNIIKNLNKALLVMHAPFDTTVGIENAARIYQSANHPKSFISLDDADHLLSNKVDSLYVGQAIASWLQKYIPEPAEPDLTTDLQVVVQTDNDGFVTDIKAGNHFLIADEPVKVGGTDLGPTPYDLLVAALGSCTSMTLHMYADHKGWADSVENIKVHLEHNKIHAKDCESCETNGAKSKIDVIKRYIEIEGDLSSEQRQRMLKIADRCPVHKTLQGSVHIETYLRD